MIDKSNYLYKSGYLAAMGKVVPMVTLIQSGHKVYMAGYNDGLAELEDEVRNYDS